MFLTLVTIVHIAICAVLILIVLLQQGKGADVGATFGGGSNTLFGASGADNLLTRVTTFTAVCFMITSVYLSSHNRPSVVNQGNLFQNLPEQSAPAPLSAPLDSAAPVTAPLAAPQAAPADGGAAAVAVAPETQPAAQPAVPAAPPAPPPSAETNTAPSSPPAAPPAAPAGQ